MLQPQDFLFRLRRQLNTLKERKAKYGIDVPLELLNQIEDHQKAIALTEQAAAGDITQAEWQAALRPLLLGNGHWAGISLATLLVLAGYAPDKGTELKQQVGSQAAAIAETLFTQALEQVKTVNPGTAQQFPQHPAGYAAPLGDALDELLEANQTLVVQFKTLLEAYGTAAQAHRPAGPRATLTGSGVITQQSTQTAGDGGVVGSNAGGDIITGSGNVKGDVSVTGSTGVGVGQAEVSVSRGVSGQELSRLFAVIYQQIEAKPDLSSQDKADLKADVDEIKAEVSGKTDPAKVDDSFLARRLRNIERMAPDIIDTIATTAASPVAGLKGVWDKIVARAREIKAAR